MAKIFASSSFRFALIYLAVFGLSIVTVLGILYWSTVAVVEQQIDQTIAAEIDGLADQFRDRGAVGLAQALERRISRARASRGLYFLADQRFFRIVGNLDRWPTTPPQKPGWVTFPLEYADTRDRDFGRAYISILPGPRYLLVGRDIRELGELTQRLQQGLIWSLAAALLLAALGGYITTRLLLRRLSAINQTARDIISGDLTRRVPVSGREDEFDDLAQQLNRMLERIDHLMTGLRQVSNDIAHDLRTPLSRLRNRLDQLLVQQSDPVAHSLLQDCLADADQLLNTFQALLRIAEAESGSARARFNAVDVAAMLPDLIDLYAPVAEDKGVDLHLTHTAPVSVFGDRHILFQAIANLLDNAIKFSPAGIAVELSLKQEADNARISVLDRGPGIPAEFRDKATERFQRLDASRQQPGNGLGLALVKAAVHLHDGRLSLQDNHPGLAAHVILPILHP